MRPRPADMILRTGSDGQPVASARGGLIRRSAIMEQNDAVIAVFANREGDEAAIKQLADNPSCLSLVPKD